MRAKRRALLAPLGLAALMLISAAGCGGSQPAPSASAPASQPAAGAGASQPAQPPAAKQKVSFNLDWIYQGPNIGFVVARSKGFYDQAGLDVTVNPGTGSGTTAELVGTGSTMIGFADGYVVANSVAKGMPLIMVASIYRRNPNGVTVLADSPIKTPKDLEGHSVGITPGSSQFQQWPAFVKGCKLDASKIKLVNVQPNSAPQALLQHQFDALGGYVQGFAPTIEVRGKTQTRALWYSDCGVTAVSNGIIVQPSLLKSNPDLVRKFVAASIQGFLYARQHPDEAIQILKTYSPTIDPQVTRREMELSWQTWVPPSTRGKPLGWMSPDDWAATLKVLQQYGGVQSPPKPEQVYTNDFVPTGDQYVPPQG